MKIQEHMNLDDIIFTICINEIPEFKEYITGFDDIIEVLPENNVTMDFRKIIVDAVMKRANGMYVNIEHQTIFNTLAIIKSLKYYVTFIDELLTQICQFIFFTGDKKYLKSTVYSDEMVDYHPNVIITKDVDGDEKINNVKRKIKNQETIHAFDIIDLIWLIRFDNSKTEKEVLLEIIDLAPDLKIEKYENTLKKCIFAWTIKYIIDENEIKKMKEAFHMLDIHSPEYQQVLQVAVFERETEKILKQRDEILKQRDEILKQKDEIIQQKDEEISDLKKQLAMFKSI